MGERDMRRALQVSRTRSFIIDPATTRRRRQVNLVSVGGGVSSDCRVLPLQDIKLSSSPSSGTGVWFSSASGGGSAPPPPKRKEDPFQVLGIPRGSSYQQAKKAFLKLALEHHPDKQDQSQPQREDDSTSSTTATATDFIRIRQAFEVIREGTEGQAIVTTQNQWTEEELHDFIEEQTNDFLTFKMDTKTRKEVIETFENLSPGGLDRGGSWMMARMLAEREKSQLVEGTVPTPKQISGNSRVNRRRKR